MWDTTSDYGVQPPLTEEAITEAEEDLDVTLPAALLDLLRTRNGGPIAAARSAFPTSRPTSWAADHVPFDHLMGIGDRNRVLSLLDSPYLTREWELPAELVLLSGDGHQWIALDYRAGGRHAEPSVTWFDAEFGRELALAPDFGSFLAGLTAPDDLSARP
ncbi:SMI1/KNR4 family protein [Kitasatospora viridis]|uniref:SMI1/KNR4 family protein SUKH-1 n=1 Tax=Kitasatospora viridis TaxID=281105 RepID=A0A561UQ74_9ACTN|nr:SMI1/KNR4 family protein [Kitasatospora viridis]TWG01504.1 SMI1/KNR4 family protein SUKH-1 [Kitasatospora viridis]